MFGETIRVQGGTVCAPWWVLLLSAWSAVIGNHVSRWLYGWLTRPRPTWVYWCCGCAARFNDAESANEHAVRYGHAYSLPRPTRRQSRQDHV